MALSCALFTLTVDESGTLKEPLSTSRLKPPFEPLIPLLTVMVKVEVVPAAYWEGWPVTTTVAAVEPVCEWQLQPELCFCIPIDFPCVKGELPSKTRRTKTMPSAFRFMLTPLRKWLSKVAQMKV